MQGGAGDDLLSGGAGADVLDGGNDRDALSYLDALEPVTVSLLAGQGTRGEATGDVVSNFEILYGSGVSKEANTPFGTGDILTGSDAADTIYAMPSTDTVNGADGNDTIYGDIKDSTGYPRPGYDADRLNGDAGNDTLLGGLGDDHLRSMNVGFFDILVGETGHNRLSADYSDHPQPITFTVGQANAMTFPDGEHYKNMQTIGSGAGEVDRLNGGANNDIFVLGDGNRRSYDDGSPTNPGLGGYVIIEDFTHRRPTDSASPVWPPNISSARPPSLASPEPVSTTTPTPTAPLIPRPTSSSPCFNRPSPSPSRIP